MTHERGGRRRIRLAFFRTLGVLFTGHILSKALGVVAFAALARTLDRDGYGAVEYLVGLSALFTTVINSGFGTAAIRGVAHDARLLPRLAAQVPRARLGLALLSVPAMVLVATPARLGPATHGLVWLFALSLLPAVWRQDWLLQATGRMRDVAIAQALRTILFCGLVLTLVRDRGAIVAVGWAEIASVSAMSLYTLVVQQPRVTPWRPRQPSDGFLALAREGVVLGLANIVWAVNHYAPLLLMATFVGADETAWFGAASRITGSLLTFPYLYFFGLYPAIARGTMNKEGALQDVLAASFRVAAWSGILVALTVTLLAAPLSALIFGSAFQLSAPILAIMAWMVPIALLAGHARWSLVAAGLHSLVVYAHLAGTLAVALLGLPLIVVASGLGGALASVVASLAVWLTSHILARRHGAWLPAFTVVVAPGVLALAVLVVSRGLALHGWSAGVAAVLFAAAAPVVDRRLLRDLLRLGAIRPDASVSAPA